MAGSGHLGIQFATFQLCTAETQVPYTSTYVITFPVFELIWPMETLKCGNAICWDPDSPYVCVAQLTVYKCYAAAAAAADGIVFLFIATLL